MKGTGGAFSTHGLINTEHATVNGGLGGGGRNGPEGGDEYGQDDEFARESFQHEFSFVISTGSR